MRILDGHFLHHRFARYGNAFACRRRHEIDDLLGGGKSSLRQSLAAALDFISRRLLGLRIANLSRNVHGKTVRPAGRRSFVFHANRHGPVRCRPDRHKLQTAFTVPDGALQR